MYVYKETQTGIWTVGFIWPDGQFYAESDYAKRDDAAGRVHYLNGGIDADLIVESVNHVCSLLSELNNVIADVMMERSHDQN